PRAVLVLGAERRTAGVRVEGAALLAARRYAEPEPAALPGEPHARRPAVRRCTTRRCPRSPGRGRDWSSPRAGRWVARGLRHHRPARQSGDAPGTAALQL